MGNFCKTVGQPNYKSSQYNNKRVNHEAMEDPDFKDFCAEKLKAKVKKVATKNRISASEFLRICSQNRPKGVSDDSWYMFLCSISPKYFNRGLVDEFDSWGGTKSENFAVPVRRSPSRCSTDAVMNLSIIEEATPRSSISSCISFAQFATRLELSEFVKCEKSDEESTSIWLQGTECSSFPEHRSSSVRSGNDFVSVDDVGAESCTVWNSNCTALCLGDLPSGSAEDNLNGGENKIFTTFDCSVIESGANCVEGIDLTRGPLNDDIMVNRQISRSR